MHHSEYDPSLASAVLDQAAGLLKSIGMAAHHVILIGGSVPGLLVPELYPGIEPHLGTTDLDFCLSIAITEGETAEYERIEQGLKQAGFEPQESWRWRGGPEGRLLVEFFAQLDLAGSPANRSARSNWTTRWPSTISVQPFQLWHLKQAA